MRRGDMWRKVKSDSGELSEEWAQQQLQQQLQQLAAIRVQLLS